MSGLRPIRVHASVGRGGANVAPDVRGVQVLINAHLPHGVGPLAVDGRCGPATVRAIEAAQRELLNLQPPDGRVDPHGPTLRRLNLARKPGVHPDFDRSPPRPAAPALASRPAAPAHPGAAPAPRLARPAALPRPAPTVPADVIAAAKAAKVRWGVPASISIAQWMVESGFGKHMPPGSNNPFGIKAAGDEPFVLARTREEIDGRSVHIKAKFRKFDSLAEAFDLHGELLAEHPAYKLARKHLDDPDGYADALTHHYATDSHYGQLLKTQMKAHDLYQYDK